jgi:hypothetical protein
MKVLLINDNVDEYNDWIARLNDWFLDNHAFVRFMSVDDSGHVQHFYNHLYVYLDIADEHADFFLLTWGKYVEYTE